MIPDWLVEFVGENPAAYPDADDRLAIVLAFLTDLIVPYGQILLFILPFFILWLKRKKWRNSLRNLLFALVIGSLLAWGAWWADWWILALGQAAAFNAIYGN